MEDYWICGCAQQKGCFKEYVGPKYIEQASCLVGKTQDAMIMLDQFQCRRQESFVKQLSALGCDVDSIPACYTCVLQPADVGFNAPFKHRIKQ
jgi:hypothetical protein